MNNLEIFLAVCCAIFCALCYTGMRFGEKNVYLKYKEQKVGGKK